MLPAQEVGGNDSRFDLFGGYSGYRMGGKLNGVTVPDFKSGFGSQLIVSTSRWTGVVVDLNGNFNSGTSAVGYAFGVRFHHRLWRFDPFGQAQLGGQYFSPKGFPSQNMPAYIFGGGLDVRVDRRFSIRPFQLSYVNATYNKSATLGTGSIYFNGARLQAGIVYHMGLTEFEGPVSAACGADPAPVNAGEPVKITVATKGFLPRRRLTYSYKSDAGAIAGHEDSATVDTAGVRPGSYTVNAEVVDNGKGKHRRLATCEASFEVSAPPAQAPEAKAETNGAPQLQAPEAEKTAAPAETGTASSGAAATAGNKPESSQLPAAQPAVEQAAVSPAAVPEAKAEANGAPQLQAPEAGKTAAPAETGTASSSAAARAGNKPESSQLPAAGEGKKAANSLGAAQLAKPKPARFGTIRFQRDHRRPTRVDNEAKAELDRYADALQAAPPDTVGVVVGFAGTRQKPGGAARRAVNTKDYLCHDKGIDRARIVPRSTKRSGKKVELWLSQSGAAMPPRSTAVDEDAVKAVPRAPLKPKARTH